MKKVQYTRLIKWFTLLMITILAVGCNGGDPNPPGTGTDSFAVQNKETATTEVARHAVGETFVVNSLTWTVVGSEQLTEVESMFSDTQPHQPSNGAWLVVTLDFQGSEGMAGGFDIAALKIRDASGKLYNVAEPGGAADDYRLTHEGVKNLSLAMLNDTQVQHVFAIYDVSNASGPFTLEWMGAKNGSLITLAKVDLSN